MGTKFAIVPSFSGKKEWFSQLWHEIRYRSTFLRGKGGLVLSFGTKFAIVLSFSGEKVV